MHNQYSVLYNELVFNLLEARFGKGEAVVFARAAAAGGQRSVLIFQCANSMRSIARQIPRGKCAFVCMSSTLRSSRTALGR